MTETQVAGTTPLAEPVAGARRTALEELAERAGVLLLVAVALGALGQLLFYGVGLGINYPIAIVAILGAGWILRRDRRPHPTDVWLAPAAVAFAAFAAIRADPTMVALDILASLALAICALASFSGSRVVSRSFAGVVRLIARGTTWVAGGAAGVARVAAQSFETPARVGRTASDVAPVLRGVVIAVPVVLIFVVLFASADAVFASFVDRLFDFRLDLGEIVGRVLLTLVLAWAAAGALGLAGTRSADEPRGADAGPALRRRGATEALVVLAAVDAVFAVFVVLQAAYLFGGLDTLAAAGLTYAEYARRGFFELVAVVVLSGSLILGINRAVGLRTLPHLVAACILTVLTSAVLVSAGMRLRLYQEAYGWTEFRLYVLATIIVFGIGLIGLLAALLTDRVRWLGHLLIGGALMVGLVLNVLGPARFITEQNVARLLDPALVPPNGSTGLDESYVLSLGDDAVPELLRALPALPEGKTPSIRTELARRLRVLQQDSGLNAWQAWNAGRAAARDALERAEAAGDLR